MVWAQRAGVTGVLIMLASCGLQLTGLPDDGGVTVSPEGPGADGSVIEGGTIEGGTVDGDASTLTPDGKPGRARVTQGLIALYEMEESVGPTLKDTSGFAPALDLTRPLTGTSWQPGALRFSSPTLVSSGLAATKITVRCAATNEVTLEAWFTYGALPDWSRIVALSSSAGVGNVAMTSNPTTIGFDLRSTVDPYLRTTQEVFTALPSKLVHLVLTRNAAGEKRVYLDGVLTISAQQLGDFSTWDATLPLSIGNTPLLDRPFYGDVHLVAIYERALTGMEVTTNFLAGADP